MKALVLVDIQNDFVPGGALPVPEGDLIVPIVNRLSPRFELVVATQDWHPANHGSFAANHPGKKPGELVKLNGLTQMLWPIHCVQGTRGAEFLPSLDLSRVTRIFQKGTDAGIDSYSGLYDNAHRKATGLGDFLREQKVDEMWVAGLATDYCVKFTALDALGERFKTHLIEDACRGVNLNPGDAQAAIEEMRLAGVRIVQAGSVP